MKKMNAALLPAALALAVILSGASCASLSGFSPPPASRPPDEVLDGYVSSRGLPGLAAAVGRDGQIVYQHAAGVRKRGAPEPIAATDAFHIGSCTKSMTALLCARLVERGQLSWASTIESVLGPDTPMRDEHRNITLEQLLSHTAGFPAELPLRTWLGFFPYDSDAGADRARMVEAILALKPIRAKAPRFLYSNLGYVIAGAMAERASGKDWETLMRDELFAPLGMDAAGFGPPAARDPAGAAPSAPWGHRPRPIDPHFQYADNPAALGPAGTVHATLADLASYAAIFANRGLAPDGSAFIREDTLAELIRPRLNDYALGWATGVTPKGTRFIAHDGSNTTFYALLVVMPDANGFVIVLANRGDGNSGPRVTELAMYLAERFFGNDDAETP